MEEKIRSLKCFFNELFNNDIYNNSYIEISNVNEETVLRANQEGLLLLAKELVKLCDSNILGRHYHLDECGMADKCDKPMVITLSKAPWQIMDEGVPNQRNCEGINGQEYVE
ncbi:MAG: hypothetical protein LBH95_02075 [Oscillospiraceae bacterium]|jgi:hypothetical protein|nr:hypothetical protein [Oscillospiraceae bacterium]